MPYYRVTRFLHALIACGITLQMLVSLLMVYPRPGRLPNAWWEVHEIAGLLLVAALGLHWAWSIGRTAVKGTPFLLVPWFSTARLKALREDLVATVAEIRNGRLPQSAEPRPLPAVFQGLGLLLASFLAVTGLAMFFGMAEDRAMGAAIGALKEAHGAAAPLMWAYLVIHPALGISTSSSVITACHRCSGSADGGGLRFVSVADRLPARMVEVRAVCIQRLEHAHRAGHPRIVRFQPVDPLKDVRQNEVQLGVGFGRQTAVPDDAVHLLLQRRGQRGVLGWGVGGVMDGAEGLGDRLAYRRHALAEGLVGRPFPSLVQGQLQGLGDMTVVRRQGGERRADRTEDQGAADQGAGSGGFRGHDVSPCACT